MTKGGIIYRTVEEVQVKPFQIQGTVYTDVLAAKLAAGKLFCNTTGVIVKRVKGGFGLFWWRQDETVC